MKEQKVVSICKRTDIWLLGGQGSDTYLYSQCPGNSGIEKDLRHGWIVINVFEDRDVIVLLMERK